MPALSLLIATVNRIEPLRLLFESLASQTCKDFEVLVADQNPPEVLAELFAEFEGRFPLRVVPASPQGVSKARNILLPHALGNFTAFPDDDCFYAPDTVERVLKVFQKRPDTGAFLGLWLFPEAEKGRLKGPDRFEPISRFSAFKRGGTHVQFYRREAVEAAGGFDPLLGPGTGLPYGCGEDTDYLLRVLQAGFTVERTDAVRVFHPAPVTDAAAAPKLLSYGQGRMYLLRKHKFPLWFKLANIFYPLAALPKDALYMGMRAAFRYRRAMFQGRLQGFLQK